MEASQFVKGKGQILTEYQKNRAKLGNAVAGRGFSFEPGFMYDAQNEIETDAKFKLSELNYTLLQSAIERELKQSGLDYDLAYKNAAIAWELDKQALITDWDKELSLMKQAEAHEDYLIKILAIEVSKRAIELIEAKTAIDRKIEGYQTQIAALDGTTGAYEIQLAEAKIRTARKKLELIPYIETLIDLESDLIGKEQVVADKEGTIAGKLGGIVAKEMEIAGKHQELLGKAQEVLNEETVLLEVHDRLIDSQGAKIDAETLLLAAEETAMNLRETLIRPALEALIAKMELYLEELPVQLDLYNQIADVKTEIVDIKEDMAEKQDTLMEKRRELAETITELTALSEALISYKEAKLSPVISELIETLNEYIGGGSSGGGGGGSIFGGGGGGGGGGVGHLEMQTLLKQQIADVRTQIAELALDKVEGELSVDASELALESNRAALDAAKLAIDTQRNTHRVTASTQETGEIATYATKWAEAQAGLLQHRDLTFNTVEGLAKDTEEESFDANIDNRLREAEATRDAMETASDEYEDFKEREAEIRTAAKGITARLNHLLTQG